jgi:hypothetical protein
MEMSNELDVPSSEMLAQLCEELEEMEIQLKIAVLHQPVRDMLQATGLLEKISFNNFYPSVVEAALDFALEHLDDVNLDDIDTVVDRINALTGILTSVFEDASEEQQAKIDAAIGLLDDIRSRIEPQ